jgi:hypothetical protein
MSCSMNKPVLAATVDGVSVFRRLSLLVHVGADDCRAGPGVAGPRTDFGNVAGNVSLTAKVPSRCFQVWLEDMPPWDTPLPAQCMYEGTVKTCAAGALWALSGLVRCNAGLKTAVVDDKTTMDAVKVFLACDCEELQRAGASMVSTLAFEAPDAQSALVVRHDIFESLLHLANTGSPTCQGMAMSAIGSVVRASSKNKDCLLQTADFQASILAGIVRVLRLEGFPKAQLSSLQAVISLCADHEGWKTALGQYEAGWIVTHLVGLLDPASGRKCELACNALYNLCALHVGNQKFVADAEGVRKLVELLDSDFVKGNDRVDRNRWLEERAACTLLALASNKEGGIRDKLVSCKNIVMVLSALLRLAEGHELLTGFVSGVMRALIIHQPNLRLALVAAGVLPDVVHMLSAGDKNVQEHGATTLLYLMKGADVADDVMVLEVLFGLPERTATAALRGIVKRGALSGSSSPARLPPATVGAVLRALQCLRVIAEAGNHAWQQEVKDVVLGPEGSDEHDGIVVDMTVYWKYEFPEVPRWTGLRDSAVKLVEAVGVSTSLLHPGVCHGNVPAAAATAAGTGAMKSAASAESAARTARAEARARARAVAEAGSGSGRQADAV